MMETLMTRHLDVTSDHCPMTFVKTKLELEKLGPGDRLEVLLNQGEPLSNVPRSATEAGYTVIEIVPHQGTVHKVVIEKP
jgi:TusA-related sulfurtransferase